jgi:mRNA-degrading endonuclease YafQ of YafQ-DinJ toxin-antitoxin module
MGVNVLYARNFAKSCEDKLALFCSEPFHPSLKTHKLSGDLKGYFAFSK